MASQETTTTTDSPSGIPPGYWGAAFAILAGITMLEVLTWGCWATYTQWAHPSRPFFFTLIFGGIITTVCIILFIIIAYDMILDPS